MLVVVAGFFFCFFFPFYAFSKLWEGLTLLSIKFLLSVNSYSRLLYAMKDNVQFGEKRCSHKSSQSYVTCPCHGKARLWRMSRPRATITFHRGLWLPLVSVSISHAWSQWPQREGDVQGGSPPFPVFYMSSLFSQSESSSETDHKITGEMEDEKQWWDVKVAYHASHSSILVNKTQEQTVSCSSLLSEQGQPPIGYEHRFPYRLILLNEFSLLPSKSRVTRNANKHMNNSNAEEFSLVPVSTRKFSKRQHFSHRNKKINVFPTWFSTRDEFMKPTTLFGAWKFLLLSIVFISVFILKQNIAGFYCQLCVQTIDKNEKNQSVVNIS